MRLQDVPEGTLAAPLRRLNADVTNGTAPKQALRSRLQPQS
jgi:hypothetical protein